MNLTSIHSVVRRLRIRSVVCSVVCTDEITQEGYSTTLTFSRDLEMFKDATGLSITFTLGTGNINGVGKILRLNKPTAVSFPATFEAHANSAALDATKMNVYTLVYFSNWNGSGTARVIYNNSLYTAV